MSYLRVEINVKQRLKYQKKVNTLDSKIMKEKWSCYLWFMRILKVYQSQKKMGSKSKWVLDKYQKHIACSCDCKLVSVDIACSYDYKLVPVYWQI